MNDSLKQWLTDHDINYVLHTHPAVFTVPEAKKHSGYIPGTHCKNLFLKNKKTAQLYLVTIPYDKRLDLNQFRRSVGAPKIRFAGTEDLLETLGITPGAVSPIGLVNDTENRVIFVNQSYRNFNGNQITSLFGT
ncbi:MAG: YbaK/EbsC family protein [Promethearchaeota archaeon]|jgi:Ala-tRNA(Pro) deacylase